MLEALGSTKLNLLLDVGFNKEVGRDAALYWNKEYGNLACLIEKADQLSAKTRNEYSELAKARVREAYSWSFIGNEYIKLWNTIR